MTLDSSSRNSRWRTRRIRPPPSILRTALVAWCDVSLVSRLTGRVASAIALVLDGCDHFLERSFDRKPLDARSDLNAVGIRVVEQVLGVLGNHERRSMSQQDHVRFDSFSNFEMSLRARSH